MKNILVSVIFLSLALILGAVIQRKGHQEQITGLCAADGST